MFASHLTLLTTLTTHIVVSATQVFSHSLNLLTTPIALSATQVFSPIPSLCSLRSLWVTTLTTQITPLSKTRVLISASRSADYASYAHYVHYANHAHYAKGLIFNIVVGSRLPRFSRASAMISPLPLCKREPDAGTEPTSKVLQKDQPYRKEATAQDTLGQGVCSTERS